MANPYRALIVLLSLSLSAFALCQSRTIRSGDLLRIRCFEDPTYSVSRRVDADGRVRIAELNVLAAGSTAVELSQRICEAASLPQGSIEVVLIAGKRAPIRVVGPPIGEALLPAQDGVTLVEALRIVLAGQSNDTDRVRLETSLGESIDYEVDLASSRGLANPVLSAGDTIWLLPASGPPTVTVLGAVAKPGPVAFRSGMTALDAISLAGKTTPQANESNLRIVRQGAELDPFPLDQARDVTLRRGDSLVVAASTVRRYVTVVGEVANGGLIDWKQGMTLEQAIQAAGGLNPRAGSEAIRIRRVLGQSPFAKLFKFSSDRGFVLQAGDVVQVPPAGQSNKESKPDGPSRQPRRVVPPR